MPQFRCTWSIDKYVKPKNKQSFEIPSIEANNETHVVELVRAKVAREQEVSTSAVTVVGITRIRS